MDEPAANFQEPVGGPGPEQGGGPPAGLPWTLIVEGDEPWSADLEHGAHLPCVGDRIDYIADDGHQHIFRVREIIHTVQRAATERPPVNAERFTPNSTVNEAAGRAPRELRAGLPRVIVTPER